MNKLLGYIAIGLVALLVDSDSAAGAQPMLLRASGPLRIIGTNRTVSARGYCLNRRLRLPSRSDSYRHFSDPNAISVRRTPAAGSPSPAMPLSDAIDKGYLRVRGDDEFGLTFESLDNASYEIEVRKSVVAATDQFGISSTSDLAQSADLIRQIEESVAKDLRQRGGLVGRLADEIAHKMTQDLTWEFASNPSRLSRDAILRSLNRELGKEAAESVKGFLGKLERSATDEKITLRAAISPTNERVRLFAIVHADTLYLSKGNGEMIAKIAKDDEPRTLSSLVPEGEGDILVSSSVLKHPHFGQMKLGVIREVAVLGNDPNGSRIRLRYSEGESIGLSEAGWLEGMAIPKGLEVLAMADVQRPRLEGGKLLLPRALPEKELDGLHDLVDAFDYFGDANRASLYEYCSKYPYLTAEHVWHVGRVVDAPKVDAKVEGDRVALETLVDGKSKRVQISDLKHIDPLEWAPATDDLWIVDVTRVKDNEQLKTLCEECKRFEAENDIEVYFATGEGSEARLAAMFSPASVSVTTDDSIRRISSRPEQAYRALQDLERQTAQASGPRVEVLAGHDGPSEQILGRWIKQARDGRFRGKHLVVVACNLSPQRAMFDFAREALANGAHSVVCADDALSAHAFTLAAARIRAVSLQDETPLTFWRNCYRSAAESLEKCLEAGEPAEAARKEFGSAAEILFDTDGKLNRDQVEKLLDTMESLDPSIYHQFGSRTTFRNGLPLVA